VTRPVAAVCVIPTNFVREVDKMNPKFLAVAIPVLSSVGVAWANPVLDKVTFDPLKPLVVSEQVVASDVVAATPDRCTKCAVGPKKVVTACCAL